MKRTAQHALTASVVGLSLMALGTAGCGGKKADSNVAVVNGEAITMDDFHSYLMRKQTVQVVTQNGVAEANVAGTLAFQALRDMVNRRILMQIAKDEGVYPTETDITNELEFQTARRPSLVKDLAAQGFTLQMIKADLALDLCRERVLTKGITVSDAEVEAYIKDNPKQFREPEMADLLLISVKREEDKKRVDQELNSGQTFAVVAQRYSTIPGARTNGGRFNERVVERFSPKLKELVAKTQEGRSTEWVQNGADWVKFYIEQKIPAKPIKIDKIINTLVRRQMAMRRGSVANDLGKRLQEKLKKGTIEVQLTALKEPWNKAFENLQAEDATQGTQSSTSKTGVSNN